MQPAAKAPGRRPVDVAGLVALGAGIVSLLLVVLPFVGLSLSVLALGLSLAAWVRARRAGRPIGLAATATGLALSVLAIGLVWSLVSVALTPTQRVALDCDLPNLAPLERAECEEESP